MADASAYWRTLTIQLRQLVTTFNDLNTAQDMQTQDSGLAAAAAKAAQDAGRTDLAAVDFTNAASAINQLLFAYNSGSPAQKSYIFKML
jgi:hypothetical protein